MSGRKKKKDKILVLIDLENIRLNIETPLPGRFSRIDGFDRVIKQIAREVGEIVHIFAFAPPQTASNWGEDLYKLGFTTVYCPRIRDKSGEEKDTVDETLRNFAVEMIRLMPDVTHLCLGSGDSDFVETCRKAIRKRLKILLVVGNLTSLSLELLKQTDEDTATGKKMIYMFSPTETED